ncbi:hypothetical protein JCM3774_003554 [Rhodotorula dairenensis]
MGLVDYGSDSDSDSLPPPPKRTKTAEPRRILLDLPPPSTAQPSTSQPRVNTDKDKDKDVDRAKPPLTGLAAMLPKPKNLSTAKPPTVKPITAAATAGPSRLEALLGLNKQDRNSPMMLPPSVAKAAARAGPQPVEPEPAADFFGIGSVSAAASGSGSSRSAGRPSSSLSSAPSLSAAPVVSSSSGSAATHSTNSSSSTATTTTKATQADPYPGFTQLPSGEWVAKDQETYEKWMAWQQQQQAGLVAEGFDEKDLEKHGGAIIDVDEAAQRARDAWNSRPGAVVPGKAEGHKPAAAVKGIPSQLSGSAKRKHQLSSLLAAAHDNRAELEERIAQARQNRKQGSNKYGF